LLRSEPQLSRNRVSDLLPGRAGASADLSVRVDSILTVDRVDDLRDGDIELGQLIGLYPDSHGVLAGAENLHLGNTLHTAERVAEVDIRVVGQELRVMRNFWRVNCDENRRSRERFLYRNSVVAHVCRQLRFSLGVAQLGEDMVNIGVCLEIK